MATFILPDTRPYPAQTVKNELLFHADKVAKEQNPESAQLLRERMDMMLSQNHYLGLSVALSMTPNAATYAALLQTLDEVLMAKNEEEVQWFALPVVLVAGCNQAVDVPLQTPAAALSACLENYPHTRRFAHTHTTWLPRLVLAKDLAAVNAGDWFVAKQNSQAAEAFAQSLPQTETLHIESGQSVHVLFALGYGTSALRDDLGRNLQDAALPLMQAWQQSLTVQGLTLFTNPLSPVTPLSAVADGNHMRLRMALDVFAANAIRAVRLQSPRVGVVMASQEGGRLLFGFNATESQYELADQVFAWQLSPVERIEIVQQNFLDLMRECQVEHIRILHSPLSENEELPSYAKSLKYDGHNPFFAESV